MALSKEEAQRLLEREQFQETYNDSAICDPREPNQLLQSALRLIPLDRPTTNASLTDLLSKIRLRIIERLKAVIQLAQPEQRDLLGYAKRELGLYQFRRGDLLEANMSIDAAVDCGDFLAELFLIRKPLLAAASKLDENDPFLIWLSQHEESQKTLGKFAKMLLNQSAGTHYLNFIQAVLNLAECFQSGSAEQFFITPKMNGFEALIQLNFTALRTIVDKFERNEKAPAKPSQNTPPKATYPRGGFSLGFTPPSKANKRGAAVDLIRADEALKHSRGEEELYVDPSVFSPARK